MKGLANFGALQSAASSYAAARAAIFAPLSQQQTQQQAEERRARMQVRRASQRPLCAGAPRRAQGASRADRGLGGCRPQGLAHGEETWVRQYKLGPGGGRAVVRGACTATAHAAPVLVQGSVAVPSAMAAEMSGHPLLPRPGSASEQLFTARASPSPPPSLPKTKQELLAATKRAPAPKRQRAMTVAQREGG